MLNSEGFNLFGALDCATPDTSDDLFTDPQLEALADNGGPTWTRALSPGSPAIDAGNPQGCTSASGGLLTLDQRGEPRAVNGRCDIGAFELQ